MNHINHPSTNALLGAPLDWDAEAHPPCQPLPVTVHDVEGVPVVTSYWKPTAQELKALAEGGSVVLHVAGGGMPPVALEVEAPKQVEVRIRSMEDAAQAAVERMVQGKAVVLVASRAVHDEVFHDMRPLGAYVLPPSRVYTQLLGLPLIIREE